MKKLLVLLAFIAVPAVAQDFSGLWKIDGAVADNQVAATCTFKQTDTHITGSCKMDQSDKALDVKGEVKGKQVTWQYDIDYQGTTYTLAYTGAPDSAVATIKGTILVTPSESEGDFTATKQTAKQTSTYGEIEHPFGTAQEDNDGIHSQSVREDRTGSSSRGPASNAGEHGAAKFQVS